MLSALVEFAGASILHASSKSPVRNKNLHSGAIEHTFWQFFDRGVPIVVPPLRLCWGLMPSHAGAMCRGFMVCLSIISSRS